ncbi:NYN domain-containing protein [Nocardioides perillae]|uniref:Putative RNA-binding protein with PIN domain n=1 Tax=Nocardioides perillae TaxID=1119534 RepID=A0A7Y9RTF4_9ACTN|nr:putative RNA-binding protein with PIN domain [Nocardioides perillae]
MAPDADLAALPEPVRARVVALTADVLPAVTPLPPALRKVADFAPGRRARLGATAIAAALDADDDLRRRVATQLGAAAPALAALATAEVVDAPEPDAAVQDPVDRAAVLWLARPEGWEEPCGAALAVLAAREAEAEAAREQGGLARAERRVAELEEALRDARARVRDQADEARREHQVLRRRLGEARVAEKEARAALEAAEAARAAEVAAATAASSAAEAEVRRLRAQVEELQAAAGQSRSQARAEREEVSARARLLLDTVLEAAAGLRRELALPTATSTPGERAEAELVEAADPAGEPPQRPGSAAPVSPAVLEQLLARPRCRLIVDGYNVTKTAYASSTLEAQRTRLVAALAPLVARTGAETTVVFDAAAATHRPVVPGPRGVRVVWSPPGVIADDVVRRLVAAEPEGRPTVVVTSDQELRRDVSRAGARVVDATVLVAALR